MVQKLEHLGSQSNNPHRPHRQVSPQDADYSYLNGKYDLSLRQKHQTVTTYRQKAREYSNIEWSNQSIEVMWHEIFTRVYQELATYPAEPKPKVMVVGAGSFSNPITVAMFRWGVEVFVSDIAPEMLRVGHGKLTWEALKAHAAKLDELDKLDKQQHVAPVILNAWFTEFMDIVNRFEKVTNHSFTKGNIVDEAIQTKFKDDITIYQADLKDEQKHQAHGQMDKILAIACLQHLSKTELPGVLLNFCHQLADNGTFHFNLRIDRQMVAKEQRFPWRKQKGRVFTDNALTGFPKINNHSVQPKQTYSGNMYRNDPELKDPRNYDNDQLLSEDRYYTTFTMSEIQKLMQGLVVAYQKSDPDSIIKFVLTEESKHPENSKPPFRNIIVMKIPRKA